MSREILAALKVFCQPGQTVELRALGVLGKKAVCEVFSDLEAMARRAAELDAAGAQGVYFTPNPLKPDLAGRAVAARKEDVTRRHWLLIDVDPVRPQVDGKSTSSTETELRAAWGVLDACRALLEAAGLADAVVGCSGNGWHLCYPVDLPCDDAGQQLVKAILKALDQHCGQDAGAHVDVSCHDAPRIWKLYGTTARKGTHTVERPHRRAVLIEGEPWQQYRADMNTARLAFVLERLRWIEDTRKGRPGGDVVRRAKEYLTRIPPALSGKPAAPPENMNHGHDQTYHAVCRLVEGFGLTRDQALEAIREWNNRCQPPWTEKELLHKIDSAISKIDPSKLGSLRDDPAHTQPPTTEAQSPPGNGNGAGEEDTARTRLVFPAPIPASQLKIGAAVPAIWKGFINRGAITLMSALWKAGKTTLLTHLMRGMESGGSFCGLELAAGSILFVTEESESRWAKRRDAHVLRDHIDFVIRPFTAKPDWRQWQAFLAYLNDQIASKPRDLIVFDTLTNLWPVKDENDASQVQAALMPLHRISPASGQLLIHHTRKGDGEEATAARGSGALTAFVDTIVEFRRYAPADQSDRRRVLKGYGRDEDTPAELVIELTDLDGYVARGERQEIRSVDLGVKIGPLLPHEAPGLTFDEIMARWPDPTRPKRQNAFQALQTGVEAGIWLRVGRGVRGDPHRYYAVPATNGVPVTPL